MALSLYVGNVKKKFRINQFLFFTLFALTLFPLEAVAQTLPSSADPLRQNLQVDGRESSFRDLGQKSKNESAQAPLPENLSNRSFVLKEVDIKGNLSFLKTALSKTYQSRLGSSITARDVFLFAQAIQKLYFDAGYAFTQVRPLSIDTKKGTISYQIIETCVDKVDIAPNVPSGPMITDFVAKLEGRPLNTPDLERNLLILNDREGLSVISVISGVQGETSDRSHLRILLKRDEATSKSITGFLGFDNYGSNFTGPGIAQAGLDFGPIGYFLGHLNLNGAIATSLQEMEKIGFSYDTPLYGVSGLTLELNGEMTRTEPGENLRELDVKGKSSRLGAELSYPIIRQREENWWIQSGLISKDSNTDITADRLYDDRLRIISLGTKYNFSDSMNGMNAWSIDYDKGLDILGSRKTGSENLSRRDGKSDFSKLTTHISRLQYLPYEFDILASFSGQYTKDPLLSSEEFGFGGGVVGRGYDPSEITGDKGYSVSIEVRKNFDMESIGHIQPYTYFDFGKVWNIDPSSKNAASAAAAGLGVRYYGSKGWTVDTTLAVPLTRSAENPPPYANNSSPRFLLRINKSY